MWIHWPFFPKTWPKGHWPLDDLWPHVCWGHMCDSTQGSLCLSPMTIHQCMWIQWSILQNTTYIHILRTYYIHTTYRMSDHIVSYWTQFRRDKNDWGFNTIIPSRIYIYTSIGLWRKYWPKKETTKVFHNFCVIHSFSGWIISLIKIRARIWSDIWALQRNCSVVWTT